MHFDQVTGNITGSSGSERMGMGNAFYFKSPDFKGLETLQRMPRMDEETMRATREAMKASQDAMRASQDEMRRAQKSMGDSAMREMSRALKRAQITMDRQRFQMDSARGNTRWYQWNSDSADDEDTDRGNDRDDDDDTLPRKHKMSFRYNTPSEHHSSTISKDGLIIIDKDGGSIQLEDAPKGARVMTGGGAIMIGKSRGDVSAETGGGNIDLGPIEGGADATTGAGNVVISLVGERPHPVNITSGKGSVELVLPKDANVTLDLETAYTENSSRHTKITGDWPLKVTETDEWDDSHGTPRKYVRVRQDIGRGGPVVHIRTVNGDITIKRGS